MESDLKMKAFHTFDYELYFGSESGTPEKCLIQPMNLILEFFEKHNLSGVLFLDSMYLMRLATIKSSRAVSDYQTIIKQLKQAVAQGFSIELHLHPHWLDALYDESTNQWTFPHYKHYTLQSLDMSEISQLIRENCQIVQDISGVVPKIFRAGGWCVEPFSKIKDSLLQQDIKYDSSVVPGLRFPNALQPFDFSKVEMKHQTWKFDNCSIHENSAGPMTEIPVTTYRKSFLKRLVGGTQKKRFEVFGDGRNMLSSRTNFLQRFINKLRSPGIGVLSLETEKSIEEGNQLIRDYNIDALGIFVTVTHPKGLEKTGDIRSTLGKSWILKIPSINLEDIK